MDFGPQGLDGYEDEEDDDLEFIQAQDMNRRLKEMLRQAEVDQLSRRSGQSSSRSSSWSPAAAAAAAVQPPRVPARSGGSVRGYYGQESLPPRPSVQSSSEINRRRQAEKVVQENQRIISRITEQSGFKSGAASRASSSRRSSDRSLPPGWTRGVGGRAMPPPKQRWGKSYDAGEWNS
eukprot:TRINITY_DN72501_c0_g1_i1.p1 TRINITY_DN72501_c0_g1~~TRINITY_DN72501_c0_g1_i1.p1  ORF type:complete len:178 (+),score=40.24 TRINITY_DN72501_c0_g1_i1:48-581(+)